MDQPRPGLTQSTQPDDAVATSGLIRLNRAMSGITSLGPGRRLGVWVQGCTLACPGCASQDTWDADGGRAWSMDELSTQLIAEIRDERLDGVSLTGGEPLQQPDGVRDLLQRLRPQLSGPLPVLLFTGYPWDAALARAPWLNELCDLVIAGRYLAGRPGPDALVASTNQRVWSRDGAVRQVFTDWRSATAHRLQVTADSRDLYLVGVPGAGELDAFTAAMARRGVRFDRVTWRAEPTVEEGCPE